MTNTEKESNPEDIQCPVCGYYCLGRGGFGCIDKPFLVKHNTKKEITEMTNKDQEMFDYLGDSLNERIKEKAKERLPRVRILKHGSIYLEKIGYIMFSNCDGTFCVIVDVEGGPVIDLKPSEVDPC